MLWKKKSIPKSPKITLSDILDSLKVGETYTKTERLTLKTGISLDDKVYYELRRKTDYLRSTCMSRTKKTGDKYDVTSFSTFNSTHTELIIGTVSTKTKIGSNNPNFSDAEREAENQKEVFPKDKTREIQKNFKSS